ncbi:PKD domain-containing protein [Parasegetibacter sp. NRK P23]|uniref:PKD domain-containing protein n=1 Tax=Parasegetibacter sp. NRK P23 TaxID=2942999 RepID=UPI0020434561|nr:PKD domain-containing protein [Parasegetibacter sp. NRK P23]MCM5529388.1 PKD domain-containing protein [Parasegetibacter sp. NRK P23]
MKTKLLHTLIRAGLTALVLIVLNLEGARAQSETNDMITYDTVCVNNGVTWTLRITRPRHMFTANHPDTASRPVLISMPGAGEVSTNPANLTKFGPHYWLARGWDGSVKLGNGTHYPILITILTSATNVRPGPLLTLFEHLLKTYRIKRNSVHVAGLSMGGFTWGRFICYAAYAGDERAMSMVKSYVALQGVANDNFTGYNMEGWTAFGHWAKKYGGRFFGLEGTGDTRQVWRVRDAMELTVPGSAYFSYETIGGGAHCCWNDMYNPSATDWQCTGTITNPVIGTNKNYPNSMGTYKKGSNIFQWMLRQGDTTLVGSTTTTPAPAGPPIVTVGATQNLQLPLSLTTISGTATAQGTKKIASVSWAQTSGPVTALLASPLSLTTTVSNLLTSGTYVYTLTAKDDAGLQASASVTVNVAPLLAVAPTVNAGTDKSITLPTSSVTITGTASGNSGATITKTTWTQISGPGTAVIGNAAALSTTVSGLTAGTYIFRITATDSNGKTSTDDVSVVVNPAPAAEKPTTSTPRILVGQGEYQVLFIDKNQHLWGLGNLSNIGTGGKGKAGVPQRVQVSPYDLKFKDAVGGLHGAAAIDVDGYVWVMGDNDQGQHGQGDLTHPYLLPRKITIDSAGNPFNNIASMCAYFVKTTTGGHNGFFAVKEDGTLWVWGRTLGGMRGDGADDTDAHMNTLRPVQVKMPGSRKVKQIVAGNFAIALCTDGTVWTWGKVAASNLGYAATGMDYASPHQLTGLSDITQIAGSGTFNYALRKDGVLYGWGAHSAQMGDYYLIGNGLPKPTPVVLTKITSNLPSPIRKIVTNTVSTHVILEDGSMYGWGNNGEGNVGNGWERKWEKFSPMYAWDYTVAEGEIVTLPVKIAPNVKFADVFGSNVYTFYTYALDVDDNLYCWGRNKGSVLAVQTTAPNGTIVAQRQSAWDRWWPTPVNPFNQTTSYISPSKDCVDGTATGSPCTTYTIPANTAPKANAGEKQYITTSTAKLNGTASTDNVFIAYYEWSQVSGPNQAVINLPASPTPTVYGLVTGTYTFKLKVTDNGWYSDSATVQIVVNGSGNVAPVAKAGADQSITLPTSTVTLDGSTSSDEDGTISKYAWRKLSGPSAGTITSPAVAKTTVTALTAGEYIFELTVTDDNGETSSDQVKITVNPAPNKAPVANAGAAQTITLPTSSVTLDGSASSDEDGTISKYAWTKLSGPSAGTLTSPAVSKTTVTGLVAGEYVFELTVTDNSGATHKATVKVVVNPAPNKAPVANAGAAQTITLPTSSVTLDGSASSDEDGTISKYAWTKLSGPSTGTITSPAVSKTTVTGLVAGEYVFELTVTDNSGATNKATVKVVVNPAPNKAPVANAGAAQTITLPTSSVTLDGSASSDEDGTLTTYVWAKISGPSAGVISSPTVSKTTVTGLVAGEYIFELTVTDNSGATNKATVKVVVNPAPNKAPVANAGAAQTITLPTSSVTLDGSASSDEDGTLTTYVWAKISGPSAGVISSPTVSKTTVTGLVAGEYIFELTVTDNSGATNKATVKVVVNPAPNKLPVANAGVAQTITLPISSVTLDGGNSSDEDGSIVSFKWEKLSGPSSGVITSPNSVKSGVTGLTEGVYVFKITVTDNNGATAAAQVTVTVLAAPPANQAPVANAGSDITITLPVNTATLNGTSSYDSDGSIKTFSWSKVSGPSAGTLSNGSSSTASVAGLVAGTYVYELTVTDNDGASSKDQVKITVNPAPVPNQAPVANAGSDITITLPVNTATLNGTSSYDSDGSIKTFSWSKVSGPSAGTLSNGSSSTASVAGLVAGTYVYELTVTDNDGASSKDQVKITVNPAPVPNQVPVANAGSDITITLPVNTATLNGTSSYDSDGAIKTFSWSKVSGPSAGTLSNGSSSTASLAGLVAGTYVYELTVTDNDGASSKDQVKVTVNPAPVPNQAPVANAGSDITITLPVNTATLNGGASYDPDGTISTYKWSQVSGNATISNPSVMITNVTGLKEGTYVYELTVTDNKGATATGQVKITVLPVPNKAPIANAGADVSITLPQNLVVLDGSASYDPDGRIVAYSWAKLTGPSPFTIYNSNTASPTLPSLLEGTYVFELTVTDDKGAKATDKVTVVVKAQQVVNMPPVVLLQQTIRIQLPVSEALLDGSGSSDPEGKPLSFAWKQVNGPSEAAMATPEKSVTKVQGLIPGEYVFELTVRDEKGASATGTIKVVVVNSTQRYDELVHVYPNPVPAGGNATIKVVTDATNEKLVFTVYDLSGRPVLTKTAVKAGNVHTEQLYIAQLAGGSYVVEVKVDNSRKMVTRIIKNR